ncbi:MAG: hypothetical protein A2Z83_08145, partial [Omnitrophica bacterium GWA2_52_8]
MSVETKKKRGLCPWGMLALIAVWGLQSGFSGLRDAAPLLVCLALIYFLISFASTSFALGLVAIAMIFSPEISLGGFSMRRAFTLRIEDFLIPIMLLAWMARSAVQKKRSFFLKTPLNQPLLALVLFSFVSSAVGVTRGTVDLMPAFFYQAKIIEYLVLFYVVLNFIETEKQVRLFLFFTLLTVAFLAFYTLIQVPRAEMYSIHRITTPFEDRPQPATAGGYLAFSFLLVFCIMLHQKSGFRRIIFFILSVMVLVPLLYTFSRTAYISLAGGLLLLAFVNKNKWVRFLILGGIAVCPIILPASVKDRIAYTWEDGKHADRAYGVDQSSGERVNAFRRSWNAVKQNPILGLGIASWEYPDSQYARTLHELSFIGLGLWLWVFLRLFKISRWLYAASPTGTLKGLALGYCAGVIGILFHCTGSCTLYIVRIMEPFWFVS